MKAYPITLALIILTITGAIAFQQHKSIYPTLSPAYFFGVSEYDLTTRAISIGFSYGLIFGLAYLGFYLLSVKKIYKTTQDSLVYSLVVGTIFMNFVRHIYIGQFVMSPVDAPIWSIILGIYSSSLVFTRLASRLN